MLKNVGPMMWHSEDLAPAVSSLFPPGDPEVVYVVK